MTKEKVVLIPLLVDVPLWDFKKMEFASFKKVLIPLLVDVPLWEVILKSMAQPTKSLNPSFSGCPALGVNNGNAGLHFN